MLTITRLALFILVTVILSGVANAATDYARQPPPHVQGLPQYQINSGKNIEFDAFTFNTGLGKLTEGAEGHVWQREYRASTRPNNPNAAKEVADQFVSQLRSLGSANVVEFDKGNELANRIYSNDQLAVFGKFAKNGKDIWVEVQVRGDAEYYTLAILEAAEMRQDASDAPPPSTKAVSGDFSRQPLPYVGGLPQYQINSGKNIEFDAYTFNTGTNKLAEEAEGQVWQREYRISPDLPQKFSSLQVARNYANLLSALGAKVVEFDKGNELANRVYGNDQRAVFGKFAKNGKDIWVEMQVRGDAEYYTLAILEPTEMRQDASDAPPPSTKAVSGDFTKQPLPYVGSLPQYQINSGKNIEFDAFSFNTGNKLAEEVEGQVWQREYRLNPTMLQRPSALQVARNYVNLLSALGATVVEFKSGNELAQRIYGNDTRAVGGKFAKNGKEIWVEMQVRGGAEYYTLTILEPTEMRQDVSEAKPSQAARPAPAPAPQVKQAAPAKKKK